MRFDAVAAGKGESEPINVQDDERNNYTEVGFLHVPQNERFLGEHKADDGRFSVALKDLQGASASERDTFGGAKLQYDPQKTIVNLFSYQGTVLPGLVTRPVVILSVLIYVGASVCKSGFEDQCGQHMPTLTITDLTTT